MKYLGVDYGLRKIGLAVSEGLFASPLIVIYVRNKAEALQRLKQVIYAEKVDAVVIGIPESGETRKAVAGIVKELTKELQITIKIVDETLSSYAAQNVMREVGVHRKLEDAYAAVDILQNYLDQQNKT